MYCWCHREAVLALGSKSQIFLQDPRSENRKSGVVELKGMLVRLLKPKPVSVLRVMLESIWPHLTPQDNIKRQQHRRVPSRRGTGRIVGEAELLMALQRRRRALAENQDTSSSTQTQGTLSCPSSIYSSWCITVSFVCSFWDLTDSCGILLCMCIIWCLVYVVCES